MSEETVAWLVWATPIFRTGPDHDMYAEFRKITEEKSAKNPSAIFYTQLFEGERSGHFPFPECPCKPEPITIGDSRHIILRHNKLP